MIGPSLAGVFECHLLGKEFIETQPVPLCALTALNGRANRLLSGLHGELMEPPETITSRVARASRFSPRTE